MTEKIRVTQKKKKVSWNQALLEKSHPRDTHKGGLSRIILGTILKKDKVRSKDRKLDDDTQSFIS